MTYILCLSIAFLVYFIIYLMRQSRSPKDSEVKDEKEQNRENESRNNKDAQIPNETQGDTEKDNRTNRDKTRVALEEEGVAKPVERKRKISGSWGVAAKLYTSRSCANLSYNTESETDFQEDRLQTSQAYTSRYNSASRGCAGGGALSHLSPVNAYISCSTGDVRKPRPLNQCSETLMASMANLNVNGDDDSMDESMGWIDLTKLGNIFSHEGSSLYLRFAALSKNTEGRGGG